MKETKRGIILIKDYELFKPISKMYPNWWVLVTSRSNAENEIEFIEEPKKKWFNIFN